jgi:hypothetical protein
MDHPWNPRRGVLNTGGHGLPNRKPDYAHHDGALPCCRRKIVEEQTVIDWLALLLQFGAEVKLPGQMTQS